ncbi:MAG: bifunctional phosphopantothenoylcysteine decarboxylase/phosphopantothenate--cysteine ligase CoaBC [Spirochaetes bacterium]|nr:bifunctional phosphopantothenoylcysteine decarboxylase/phosphopantothenate--cysteine ligase CoaBC [Spirochaetota bacterium]
MRIILGISSSISAYKTPDLVRRFSKRGSDMFCVVTRNARHLVGIKALETVSGNRVIMNLFRQKDPLTHINLSRAADALLIAPASGNIIGKLANGIADDPLTTISLAYTGQRFIAPAMNSEMWRSDAVTRNMQTLRNAGWTVIDPEAGDLACGVHDVGRLASLDTIVDTVLAHGEDLRGKRFIVTSGATREWIDPIRYITNRSSGKMGKAIYEELRHRGATVTYIEGQVTHPVRGAVTVDTTEDLMNAILERIGNADCLIMAAAPLDFRPATRHTQKLKKAGVTSIALTENDDILKRVRERDTKIKVVAFAAETEKLVDNARAKLSAKGANLMIANTIADGFGTDDNVITVIRENGDITEHERMTKTSCAKVIVNEAKALLS